MPNSSTPRTSAAPSHSPSFWRALAGAKVVRHGRYVAFQMAAVAVSRRMFDQILARIARLRAPPVPA